MNVNEKANEISDLMAAKEEAKRKIRMLTDEELDLIAGGSGNQKQCRQCHSPIAPEWKYCPFCGFSMGDERDMSETLADIDGLTDAGDGFC